MPIKDFAPVFLHERFHEWESNNKTYMIPPIFQADKSRHEIGVTSSVIYSNKGDIGEEIIYNRLKELGDVGMFVINGFDLRHIENWNKKIGKTKTFEYSLPELQLPRQRELDFIIFHHRSGIISLEVKNSESASEHTIESAVEYAVDQLETSHALIKAAAEKIPMRAETTQNKDSSLKSSESKVDKFSIPYKKVIALPSTKKTAFNRNAHESLTEDITLLFEDDSKDISSFRVWWNREIENSDAIQMSEETKKDYERALSFILMIRHMGPVLEIEIVKEIHESLLDYTYNRKKADYPHVAENTFPNFLEWCWNVLKEKNERMENKAKIHEKDKRTINKEKEARRKRRLPFLQEHKLKDQNLRTRKGMKLLNKLLAKKKFIEGDEYSLTDEAIFDVFEDDYCLFFNNILKYFNKMRETSIAEKGEGRKEQEAEHDDLREQFSFLKLESPKDFNELELHLSNFKYITGDEPHEIDKQLFELLTSRLRLQRLVFARHPLCSKIVMSSEQLVVFEGPKKQLIIGSPGSGKTELMKLKALELQCKEEEKKKKIMYILANGSSEYPDRNSLLFYHMKEFFKRCSFVEVITIVMKRESAVDTLDTTSEIRKKIKSGEYEHAFIDECWIGSKPEENKILSDLVRGLPGYVWISSVFNYRRDKPEYDEKVAKNTQPLLTALEENDGKVSYINQVMRGTNNIIQLERAYSKLYENRSHPYGTEIILGHTYEGPPVTWINVKTAEKIVDQCVEDTVNRPIDSTVIEMMYDSCVDIVRRATTAAIDATIISRKNLILNPADILIVDFAFRMEDSCHLKESLLDRLTNIGIPVLSFGASSKEQTGKSVGCKVEKVTLLQALKRKVSEFIDGVEFPMVIVILPSEMVRKEGKLAEGAERLRSYDPYISFFRSMVKLFVISDKWTNMEEFLKDVKEHA